MTAVAPATENLTLNITHEIHVRSSLKATFAALLEQLGPANEGHDGRPLPMKIEPWPGGRWFRDLGDNNGHFWGFSFRQASARKLRSTYLSRRIQDRHH